jgi:long-chain acyl-CoA synthetase
MLTHRNVVAGAAGLGSFVRGITKIDRYFSFLPLAHIYEMGVEILMVAQGASIGFFSGSAANLVDDLQALQPTIICGVPRLWNRIVATMQSKIREQSKLKQALVNFAIQMRTKAAYRRKPHSLLFDWLVCGPFAAVLGGRVRLIVSGGAPILPDVYDFLIGALSPNIVQGYGLTEVAASVSVSVAVSLGSSSNGPVSIAAEVTLRRVDGLAYDPRGTPPSGEVLVRGSHVFRGYYKNEELTRQVLDEEGWFATGDIGTITPDGVLQIIDRVKQLVKLSQGEYLSITTLTDVYGATQGVQSVYIYADSHHDAPVAVVVPGKELVDQWATEGIAQFVGNRSAEEDVLKRLAETAAAQKLRGFERVANVVLDAEEFSVENGLLTPSLKPQWPMLRKKYESALLGLFAREK